jgi:gluconate 2-dehydrogenase gamma chain
MNRRDLLKLGAVAAARPGTAQQHAHESTATDAAAIQSSSWKPAFFDDHQNQMVTAMADLIIPATDTPGAKAAFVHRYMDKILVDSDEKARSEFIQGLGWIDGYAIRKHGNAFLACAPAEQTAMLEALDAAAETGSEPGSNFFRDFKHLTADIYYATEIGFRELNKGGRVPSTFGCPA